MDVEPTVEVHVRSLVLSACDLKQQGQNPLARAAAGSVSLGMRVYVFGGWNEKQVHSDLYVLEIEQMKWVLLDPTGQRPPPLFGHAMVPISGSEFLVIGGCSSQGSSVSAPFLNQSESSMLTVSTGALTSAAYLFDVPSNTWTKLNLSGDSIPPFAFAAASSLEDGRVFIHGGFTDPSFKRKSSRGFSLALGGGALKVTELYDLPLGERAGHAAAESDGLIFVFGGSPTDNALWRVTPGPRTGPGNWTADEIQSSGTSPAPRSFHSLTCVGGKLFVFAGDVRGDFYTFQNGRWTKPLYEGSMNLCAHAATGLQDKLIVFGGLRRRGAGADDEDTGNFKVSRKLFFLNVLEVKAARERANEYKFKIVTVGDSGVGKSCLLTRFVSDVYSDFHVSTIAFDYRTVVTMIKGKLVRLQLWDTAGQERFSIVAGSFYRGADGFVIVYDATNRQSFDHVEQWLSQVQQHQQVGPGTVLILVGNKYDLTGEVVVSEAEGAAKASKLGAVFVPASAKNSNNVEFAFLSAATALVEVRKASTGNEGGGRVSLRQGPQSQNAGGKNCCA